MFVVLIYDDIGAYKIISKHLSHPHVLEKKLQWNRVYIKHESGKKFSHGSYKKYICTEITSVFNEENVLTCIKLNLSYERSFIKKTKYPIVKILLHISLIVTDVVDSNSNC